MKVNENCIIGISLLKNEEIYASQAIDAVIDFVDKMYIYENFSSDKTYDLCKELREKYPTKIIIKQIKNPKDSHEIVELSAGKKIWFFAVDGDEIYDKVGLNIFRKELSDGRYNNYWRVDGHTFHPIQIDDKGKAIGYLTSEAKSVTKLYNMSVINSWTDVRGERLHGGVIDFKNGVNEKSVAKLRLEKSWDEIAFRVVHMCFFKRSNIIKNEGIRPIISELKEQQKELKKMFFLKRIVKTIFPNRIAPNWKLRKYKKGELHSLDVSNFFHNYHGDHLPLLSVNNGN